MHTGFKQLSRRPGLLRVSLRECLLVVAFVAVVIVSLQAASPAWRTFAYAVTMFTFMAASVLAVIDRGPRQAFAIGMVLVMVIYAAIVLNGRTGSSGNNLELDPRWGQLATSRLVAYLYRPITTIQYFDTRNNELPNYDADNPAPAGSYAYQRRSTSIDPVRFMQIAHCWWALILGYVGGHFARFVYLRRAEAEASAIEAPPA